MTAHILILLILILQLIVSILLLLPYHFVSQVTGKGAGQQLRKKKSNQIILIKYSVKYLV